MERREQITRIVEAVYSRGDSPEANETRITRMYQLAVKLEQESETSPQTASPGPRPESSQVDKSARKR